jgi:hypothetical protein
MGFYLFGGVLVDVGVHNSPPVLVELLTFSTIYYSIYLDLHLCRNQKLFRFQDSTGSPTSTVDWQTEIRI